MTNEENLDWLYRLRSEIYVYMPKEWLIPMNNALDEAIKKLEQSNSDEDCISRADAIANIRILYPDMPVVDIMGARHKWSEKYQQYRDCEKILADLPSIQPKTDVFMDIADNRLSTWVSEIPEALPSIR